MRTETRDPHVGGYRLSVLSARGAGVLTFRRAAARQK